MKKDNINYFSVGLFTLAGFIVFLFMLFKIAGNQAGSSKYYVEFQNVTGVKDGIVVTYSGYAIGSVSDVEPIETNGQTKYKLTLNVKSHWKIPQDSVAQIVMPAIISDKQIDITQGQSQTMLSPGDTLQSSEAVDIMVLVDSIAKELNQFIPQSTDNINQLLAKLHYTADQAAHILRDENVGHLNNLFKHADKSGENLAALSDSFVRVNHQLDSILNKTDSLIADNSDDIRYSVLELKKSIDAISGRLESIMYNIDVTSQNMNEFSRTLRNNPGAILGTKPPAEKHGDQ